MRGGKGGRPLVSLNMHYRYHTKGPVYTMYQPSPQYMNYHHTITQCTSTMYQYNVPVLISTMHVLEYHRMNPHLRGRGMQPYTRA